MPSAGRPRSIALAAALVLGATRADADGASGPPGSCREAVIGASEARLVFEALVVPGATDRCALDGVRTERTRMQVTWKRDGRLLEAASVVPLSCAERAGAGGKMFSVVASPDTAAACPVSLSRLEA